MQGLRRLEYRGYDSAGLGVFSGSRYEILRARGKLAALAARLGTRPLSGTAGVAHTRWATHGPPTESNAHPHTAGPVSIVHNGIVENYRELKHELIAEGHVFASETDSEVIAHLIHRAVARGADLDSAVSEAVGRLRGRYAVVAVSDHAPATIVAARNGSPLVMGGTEETFVASDVTALLDHTREVVFLEDGHIASVNGASIEYRNADGSIERPTPRRIDWSPVQAEKRGFAHYMLKEIHEQPDAIAETIAGRLGSEGATLEEELRPLDRDLGEYESVRLLACGTSHHAGAVAANWFERLARVPARCELASEFRYREPVVGARELVIPISQSGETADTLAALHLARDAGASILSICNVMESSIARASHATLYTRAGPEIGVASTKAFTAQLTCLMLLVLARARETLDPQRRRELVDALTNLPRVIQDALGYAPQLEVIARKIARSRGFLFLGRGAHYPIAAEGALKLKELTYISAEGYAAGEMKHGPIALIDETYPVIALVPADSTYERMLSSLAEVKARGGRVIAIATCGDRHLGEVADELVLLPWPGPELQPLVSAIPLQLLAYHAARFLGTDVDQPRNLAKSVTVE